MAIVMGDMKGVRPQAGDYCSLKRFHGLRSNGLIRHRHPHTHKTITAQLKPTPDEPGWVGYTGKKRAILGEYF